MNDENGGRGTEAQLIPGSRRNLGFLSGGGEMGALIRAFDWSETELGEPDGWPQSLRTAVRLMLSTQHPVFIFWGPRHRCLYNDGFRPSLGPEKHPTMLGAEGKAAWTEIWPIIAPRIDLVMRGDGSTWHEHDLVPIIRHGKSEDVYWTYSYSPIDDEVSASGVGGVLVICQDTTQRVLAERREKFMIGIADSLLTIDDPQEAMAGAAEAIGRQLGVDCVGYTHYDPDKVHGIVETVWSVPGFSDVSGTHEVAVFGMEMDQAMRAGRTLVFQRHSADDRRSVRRRGLPRLCRERGHPSADDPQRSARRSIVRAVVEGARME